MKLSLRAICLPVALLSIPQAIQAEGNAPAKSEIMAIGRMELRHGWLSISSPAESDLIVARISVRDLNLANSGDKAILRTRLGHASADLCRIALEDPEMPGSQIRQERKCLRETEAKAFRNLNQATGF